MRLKVSDVRFMSEGVDNTSIRASLFPRHWTSISRTSQSTVTPTIPIILPKHSSAQPDQSTQPARDIVPYTSFPPITDRLPVADRWIFQGSGPKIQLSVIAAGVHGARMEGEGLVISCPFEFGADKRADEGILARRRLEKRDRPGCQRCSFDSVPTGSD